MTPVDRALLRVALVFVIGFYGWQLASQTVVQLIQQNAQIAALQQQLRAHPPQVSSNADPKR